MQIIGKVKTWNEEKGFGFIRRDDGHPDVFVHISEIRRSGLADDFAVNKRVSFDTKAHRPDRPPVACNIRFLAKRAHISRNDGAQLIESVSGSAAGRCN